MSVLEMCKVPEHGKEGWRRGADPRRQQDWGLEVPLGP